MRERLPALVQAQLERFSGDGDPATVLDPAAVAEVAALLDAAPDSTTDLEAAHAAGWLHWCRYLALDPGDGEEDFAAALALFEPVHAEHPEVIPDEVGAYFNRSPNPSSDSPGEMARHGAAFLQHALGTADRAALDTAVDLLRQAVATTPTSDLEDPSTSRLLLSDHRARPLTVVDISRLRLGGPRVRVPVGLLDRPARYPPARRSHPPVVGVPARRLPARDRDAVAGG